MSYCRWSCDFYRSDLYVYESANGFESHVAGRRINVDPPAELLSMPSGTPEEWVAVMVARSKWHDSLHDENGDIPEALWLDLSTIGDEAGEHYTDATPGECAERLRELRDKGFNVPSYAIEALEEEATEPHA